MQAAAASDAQRALHALSNMIEYLNYSQLDDVTVDVNSLVYMASYLSQQVQKRRAELCTTAKVVGLCSGCSRQRELSCCFECKRSTRCPGCALDGSCCPRTFWTGAAETPHIIYCTEALNYGRINISSSTTVAQVAAGISAANFYPESWLVLRFNGAELSQDTTTLASLQIRSGAIIDVEFRIPQK
jgi:hypothetical protein